MVSPCFYAGLATLSGQLNDLIEFIAIIK
jgi:hypothetical protein